MDLIKLKEPVLYIAAGTVLIRDHEGNYFPSITDDEYVDGPLMHHPVKIRGDFFTSNPHVYEVVKGNKSKNQLIKEAMSIFDRGGNQVDIKEALNLALMSKDVG